MKPTPSSNAHWLPAGLQVLLPTMLSLPSAIYRRQHTTQWSLLVPRLQRHPCVQSCMPDLPAQLLLSEKTVALIFPSMTCTSKPLTARTVGAACPQQFTALVCVALRTRQWQGRTWTSLPCRHLGSFPNTTTALQMCARRGRTHRQALHMS